MGPISVGKFAKIRQGQADHCAVGNFCSLVFELGAKAKMTGVFTVAKDYRRIGSMIGRKKIVWVKGWGFVV